MMHLGWTAPVDRLDAGPARKGILWQHDQIRALLQRAREVAELALDGNPPTPDAVASAVGDIRSTMEIHLTFEERVLIPLLRDDLPAGPQRADALQDEHKRQRDMLSMIHEEARRAPGLTMLAVKLSALTSWLLEDMEEEERSLLTPDALRDGNIVIDQSCG
jgi:hypothetical protein